MYHINNVVFDEILPVRFKDIIKRVNIILQEFRIK